MPRLFVIVLAALILVGGVQPRGASAAQGVSSPLDLLSQLAGLESAYARKYIRASEFGLATPATPATPATARSTGVETVTVTVLAFATDADARSAFRLTSGTLVAGAILGESDQSLTSTPVKGLGDEATLYLGRGGDQRPEGLLLVRSGSIGVLVTGEGKNASRLSDVIRSFAAFVVDHRPSSRPVTVLRPGRATGGSFDLMPGPGDTGVLGDLAPVDDYDLLVNDSPIEPTATPGAGIPAPGGLRIRVAG